MSDTAAAIPQVSTQTEARTQQQRFIRPLGEQIIIRTIPQSEVGSILIPDSAKGITMMGDKGASDAVHFVEAEVIAVGPGKRTKGDPDLLLEMTEALTLGRSMSFHIGNEPQLSHVNQLLDRARNPRERIPPLVKPGDRILYHPAVQRFDREIDPESVGLPAGERCFIISEMTSVLAVIER